MRKTTIGLTLVLCLVVAAAPVLGASPHKQSLTGHDALGALQWCWDFGPANDPDGDGVGVGAVSNFLTGATGNYFELVDHPAVGWTTFGGHITGGDFVYGLFVNRIDFTGVCQRRGGSWWGWGGSFDTDMCSVSTYYKNLGGFGNFADGLSLINIGPGIGPPRGKCDGLFRSGSRLLGPSTQK